MRITFLTDHNIKIDCPYKLNGQENGTLAHAFYPRRSRICGDIHLDDENWKPNKTGLGQSL